MQNVKQCRPWSDCSSRSSLIWICTVYCSSRSSLIWVCTVCPGLSVRKLRIITVPSWSVSLSLSLSCFDSPFTFAHVLLPGFVIYFSYGIRHSFQPGYHDNLSIGDLHPKTKSDVDELFDDREQEMTVLLADTEEESDNWIIAPQHKKKGLSVIQLVDPLKVHEQPSSGTRCPAFCRRLPLVPCIVWANSEGSGKIAFPCSPVW